MHFTFGAKGAIIGDAPHTRKERAKWEGGNVESRRAKKGQTDEAGGEFD